MSRLKSPAQVTGLGLVDDLRKSDTSKLQTIKHPGLPIGKNRQKILEEIADRWSAQGLYTSSRRAIVALLEGVL